MITFRQFLEKAVLVPKAPEKAPVPKAIRILRVLSYVSLPLFPLFCLFVLDYMNYRKLAAYRNFVVQHPKSLLFECLVMLALFLALFLALRWAAAAAGVLGVLSLAFGYINYVKVSLNGDPFHPRDVSMVSSAGRLLEFISGDVPKWFFLGAAVIVLWVAVLVLCRTQMPIRWYTRLPVLLMLVAAVSAMFSTMERSNRVLGRFGMTFFDAALQSSNYRANGFVGAFTLNILMDRIETPEGYSAELIGELMEGRDGTPTSPDAPLYDVIVVLSESFFDVRTLPGVTFSQNPLSNFDAIVQRENAYSGRMYSTAAGGGTVRTEFDVLTGLTTDYLHGVASPYELVDAPVATYVSNYHDAGYFTVALHPYDKTFYRRSFAYPYLGFDEFLGQEEMSELLSLQYKRGLVTDASTLEAIRYELDRAGKPTFVFAITMQNHQPFQALPEEEIHIQVDAPMLNQEALDAVTTYTQGLADADQMLADLVDYIDQRERPTVLLFYGDHIPTLGTGEDAYHATEVLGGDTPLDQQAAYRYSTPFLIYTNTGAESTMLPQRQDNQISTYYLLDVVAEMTGFQRTPYMELLEDYYRQTPYYNVRLQMDVTDEIAQLRRMHEYLTYDRLIGERYSVAP